MRVVRNVEEVGSGDVFCAMGSNQLAERITQALESGVRWVLVDQSAMLGTAESFPDEGPHSASIWKRDGRVRVVPDIRRAYARLCQLEYHWPGKAMTAVGVTGTNGKTSVTAMLQYILNRCGLACGLVGTVKIDTGRRRFPSTLTTPDAHDLAAWLAEMRADRRTHWVMEVSSHGLDQRRTDGIQFAAGVFTNFSLDHLDYHGTVERYLAAKRRLFEHLEAESWAVVNADDPSWREMVRGSRARICTYGLTAEATVKARLLDEGHIAVQTPGWEGAGRLPGLGGHRVANALAVLATATVLGLDPDRVWEGLLNFPGVWRRLQVIETEPGWVIDDCSHNPDNIARAIAAVLPLRPRRLWVIYAIRGNRGIEINQANARALAAALGEIGSHALLITAADDLAGPNDRVKAAESEAFQDSLAEVHQPSTFFRLAEDAIWEVGRRRRSGDVVLLMGAHSMDSIAALWRSHSAGTMGGATRSLGLTAEPVFATMSLITPNKAEAEWASHPPVMGLKG